MAHWDFEVVSRGTFPLDMLRYDACYPTDSESVLGMGQSTFSKEQKKVRLRSRVSAPTDARWASFGWQVRNVMKRR